MSLGCDLNSTNQVHLSKTWIKTKLSGDRASYRIRGAQYKMKAWGPCTESRGWNFYPPFVVFSTIYQGGFSFFFFLSPSFCLLFCGVISESKDTQIRVQTLTGPRVPVHDWARTCDPLAAGFPLPPAAGPTEASISPVRHLSFPRAGTPTHGRWMILKVLPPPRPDALGTWIEASKNLSLQLRTRGATRQERGPCGVALSAIEEHMCLTRTNPNPPRTQGRVNPRAGEAMVTGQWQGRRALGC